MNFDFIMRISNPLLRVPICWLHMVLLIGSDHLGFKLKLGRANRADLLYDGSFHQAVAPVLRVAHVFGIMPVSGIKAKSSNDVKFVWHAPIAIYSGVLHIFLSAYCFIDMYYAFTPPFHLDKVGSLMFCFTVLIRYYLFTNLATKWAGLMQKWEAIENEPSSCNWQWKNGVLAHKIKMTAIVLLTMSLSEHLLLLLATVHTAIFCYGDKEPMQQVILLQLSRMFTLTTFSPWKAFLGKFTNIVATFVWTYADLFVIVISLGLSHLFRQLNASMYKVKGKMTTETFWAEHRKIYRNMCDLCEEIDNEISLITTMSLTNNIYSIAVQLLRSLNKMPSAAHAVYFWYSLIFLIGRALAMSLCAAGIHEESKKPLEVFRCVPRESWCLEVRRFSEEVSGNVVALSGMKFFYLTRNLVLSVVGTIVTYELILWQFHAQEADIGCG